MTTQGTRGFQTLVDTVSNLTMELSLTNGQSYTIQAFNRPVFVYEAATAPMDTSVHANVLIPMDPDKSEATYTIEQKDNNIYTWGGGLVVLVEAD